jgi:hypothetical protein
MKILKRFVVGLACVAALAGLAAPAAADGAPVKIFLNYLPGVSNYGPTNASGAASVSIGEATVDLTADGLPHLSGELYEAWLVTTETEPMVSLGKFNADANKHVAYQVELGNLPEADYRYFVISVEPDPDPSPAADARRTIAGVFPNPKLQIMSGTPTPTLEPGVTPSPPAPGTLPVTGGSGLGPGAWGGLLLGLGLICFVLARLIARNRKLDAQAVEARKPKGDDR